MEYYANGSGSIIFKEVLPEAVFGRIKDKLQKVLEADGSTKWKPMTSSPEVSYVDIWDSEKYYGDEVETVLNEVAEMAEIEEGSIEYVGEDDSLWRFIYRDGKWHEESGHVEYSDLTIDKLSRAIKAYAMYDLGVAERGYVYDMLTDICGLSENDLKALGMDFMIVEEKNEKYGRDQEITKDELRRNGQPLSGKRTKRAKHYRLFHLRKRY